MSALQKKITGKLLSFTLGVAFTILILVIVDSVFYFLNKNDSNSSLTEEISFKENRDRNYSIGITPPQPPSLNESWMSKQNAGKTFEIICPTRRDELINYEKLSKTSNPCTRFKYHDWIFNGVYAKLAPNNLNARSCYNVGTQNIFDTRFNTDHLGHRLTLQDTTKAHSKFMIFLGGSFIFGQGLNDRDTLPSYFSKHLQDYEMYNYAIPGAGLSNMYAITIKENPFNAVKEQEGVILYFYFDFDVSRIVPTLNEDMGAISLYRPALIEKNGEIEIIPRGGMLSTITKMTDDLIRNSNTYNYLKIDYPKPSEEHFSLYAKALAKMSQVFLNQNNKNKFIVIAYPNQGFYFPEIKKHLQKEKIRYIDLSSWKISELISTRPYYHCDNHSTKETNDFLASELSKIIKTNFLPQ